MVASEFQHQPVLLSESIHHLQLSPGMVIADGTLGGGGHSLAILEQLGPEGLLPGRRTPTS